jgi:Ca2+-binding EF-hand superfamily protein
MIVVTDANQDGKISMKEMRNMLKNIGADERDISEQDLEAVFREVGHEEGGESLIYCDEVEEILTGAHA